MMATIDERPRGSKGDEPRTTGQIMSTSEYEARERTAQARARTAEARARQSSSSKVELPASVKRFARRHPHRVLLAELLAMLTLITVRDLADGGPPAMASYVPAFVVYLVLAFASEFGEEPARVASAFGALVLVGYLLAPGHAAAILKGFGVAAHPGTGTTPPISAPPGAVTVRPSRLPNARTNFSNQQL